MKKVIYKYILKVEDQQTIEMPAGAEILTVQTQGENVCLWALVNPDYKLQSRKIAVIPTGEKFDSGVLYDNKYIATFQIGGFVGHVFEILN